LLGGPIVITAWKETTCSLDIPVPFVIRATIATTINKPPFMAFFKWSPSIGIREAVFQNGFLLL
jgi:hypothetical protein